jgi:hypothetical protein
VKPRTKRKFKLLLLVAVFAALVSGIGFVGYQAVVFVADLVRPDEPLAVVIATPIVGKKKEKKKPECGCTKHSIRFKRDHYDTHRHHAERLSNKKILTDNAIHSSPLLTEVADGMGYRIDRHKLTHSQPYLHKRAYKVLQDMGRAYSDKVNGTKAEGSTFHISSLTRTKEQQEHLRKTPSGRNATPNVSTHSYGASFDIYKFDNTNSCNLSRKAFEDMLKEFHRSGRILLCPEGNCIHVTVKG